MKAALLTAQSRVAPVFETSSTWLTIEVPPDKCHICSTHHFNRQNELNMASIKRRY